MDVILRVDGKVGEMQNDILRMDSKIDTIYRKLDAKIDKAVSDITESFEEFATDMTKRVVKLELARA